jgi:PAP2 superfamily
MQEKCRTGAKAMDNVQVSKSAAEFSGIPAAISDEFKAILAIAALCLALGIALIVNTAVTFDEILIAAKVTLYSSFLNMAILGGAIYALVRVDPEKLQLGVDWPLRVLAATVIVSFKIPFFGVFKQFTLKDRGFPLDEYIAPTERWLLGGHDAWEFTHSVFGSLYPTLVIDRLYILWGIPVVILPILWMAFVKDWQVRVRLLLCWVLIWAVIGGAFAWALGSAGPIFYNELVGPDAGFANFHSVFEKLNIAAQNAHYQFYVTNNSAMLIEHYQSTGYAPAKGISAMPSVHVAMAVLFAIGGFQLNRFIGWAFTAYAAIIWVGSVHLGWHYMSDGLVSIVLTLALWKASKFIIRAPGAGLNTD